MKYIMVTNFEGYWDRIPPRQTPYYRIPMLKGGMNTDRLKEDTKTIFIKRSKDGTKRAWEGRVANIRTAGETVYFDAVIEREIAVPSMYALYVEGWYCDEDENELVDDTNNKTDETNLCEPAFLNILRSTDEKHC